MLGVCYYPEHWPESWWADDAKAMRAMGIRFVRIGEFAWSRLEPSPGDFNWDWLDRAIAVLHAEGLRIVLGTPTAAPPKWLVDQHPDILPADEYGRPRGFGSRKHTRFTSDIWREESRRIVEVMAARYGQHPAVAGWQIDNEFGCHNTVLSYAIDDLRAFQEWLRHRYQSPDQLNTAWGNVFWSMEVRSFDEVALPVGAVTETNPAARLDYARFASAQVVCYLRMQVEILRAHSPGRFITHNFMGFFTAFDHWAAGRELDLASWDSYPLGFLERFPFSQDERSTLAETSHPDSAPFNHDLYRGVGNGHWWVMEQQPGPVNWAPWNPVPRSGMVRMWTWEALAHGAEVVSYFRWRQCPFAQEQMHAGMQRPDRQLSPGGAEATRVGEEIARMGALPESRPAPVALVFDYEAVWVSRIQPQGADFNQVELCFRWYEAARRLGLDVDIVAPGADLSGYRLVLVPSLPIVSAAAEQALAGTRAKVLFGPRSGSKTAGFSIPERLPPGPLQQLIPMRVAQVASLRPGLVYGVSGPGVEGQVIRWREWVETEADVLARFADRTPALLRAGNRHYLAGWPDSDLLRAVLARLLEGVPDLRTTELPPLVRLRRRGDLMFAFNYGYSPWTAPESNPAYYRLGGPVVGPQDVACWLFTPAVN